MSERFDVIVIGGGAWGSAVTQHLARRGHGVACLDRFIPPHASGSTHGHSRLINTNAESSSRNLDLIKRSYELWHELGRLSRRDLLYRVGYLFVGAEGSSRMARSLSSYGDVPVAYQVMSHDDVARQFPHFRLRADEIGIFDPEAARLDPEDCVRAALDVAARAGASLHFGEGVTGWAVERGLVNVTTEKAAYTAGKLVICAGPWVDKIAGFELPVWVERQVSVCYEAQVPMSGFSFPADAPATSVYGVPEAGSKIKVAVHHGGAKTDPDSVAPVSSSDLEAIHRVMSERVPSVNRVLSSATCMYTNSPDMQYIIGPHPRHDDVLIAAAGSGRGFHQAPVIGEFAADWVEGRSRPDFEWLSPKRFAVPAES